MMESVHHQVPQVPTTIQQQPPTLADDTGGHVCKSTICTVQVQSMESWWRQNINDTTGFVLHLDQAMIKEEQNRTVFDFLATQNRTTRYRTALRAFEWSYQVHDPLSPEFSVDTLTLYVQWSNTTTPRYRTLGQLFRLYLSLDGYPMRGTYEFYYTNRYHLIELRLVEDRCNEHDDGINGGPLYTVPCNRYKTGGDDHDANLHFDTTMEHQDENRANLLPGISSRGAGGYHSIMAQMVNDAKMLSTKYNLLYHTRYRIEATALYPIPMDDARGDGAAEVRFASHVYQYIKTCSS